MARMQWRPRYAHISMLTQLCDKAPTSVMISHVIRSAHHSELVLIQIHCNQLTLKYTRAFKVIMGLTLTFSQRHVNHMGFIFTLLLLPLFVVFLKWLRGFSGVTKVVLVRRSRTPF